MPKQKYFVSNSSIFDAHPYRFEVYTEVLRRAGAEVFATRFNGWLNQPEVVGFSGITLKQAEEVLRDLDEFKRFGPIIQAIDWKI